MLRSVICSVLGHVDHGKSSILDRIRGSAIVKSEPGQITQAIGASIIPLGVIKKVCGPLLDAFNIQVTIPGLLFIDTPGHAAFTNLRKRGGNLADIGILVIDVNEGFKPQTLEALEILKRYKTPFVVAANKVDLTNGWHSCSGFILKCIRSQSEGVQQELDTKMYNLVAKFAELNLESERFDRVDNYTKQIAIVPCSAKSGEGIPELMMVITGIAQRFLESALQYTADAPGRGTILEVKKEKGIGTSLDVILYDGTLRKGSEIVIGTLNSPIVTKVKALFEPVPLAEMRDLKAGFKPVLQVTAATGVKISAMGIEGAVAGMPIRGVKDSVEKVKAEVMKEVEEVSLDLVSSGIIVKADSLGSLEAVVGLLKEKGIPVSRVSIGQITQKDICDAESNYETEPLLSVVVGFNVSIHSDVMQFAHERTVHVITDDVIYSLVEKLRAWQDEQLKMHQKTELGSLIMPCKVQLLKGYVFRQSNPAILGVEVVAGTLRVDTPLMKDGRQITSVKSIQLEKENITGLSAGKQAAVSLERVMVGRQIREGDTLYSAIPEEDFRRLKELKKLLKPEDLQVMKEIAIIMREQNPVWGI